MTDKRITMITIRPLVAVVLGLTLTACSNNPMMRTTNATSTDVAEQIDQSMACLLYTSPSPRDRTRSRMPSSA